MKDVFGLSFLVDGGFCFITQIGQNITRLVL